MGRCRGTEAFFLWQVHHHNHTMQHNTYSPVFGVRNGTAVLHLTQVSRSRCHRIHARAEESLGHTGYSPAIYSCCTRQPITGASQVPTAGDVFHPFNLPLICRLTRSWEVKITPAFCLNGPPPFFVHLHPPPLLWVGLETKNTRYTTHP